MWVGGVARLASNEPDFTGHVTVPSSPGASDEFEDVVLVEQDVVVLFSAKGSLVRADVAKPGGARRDVIDWYERFFFANHDPKNKEHSAAGAIRLLNEKIDKIRAGDSPFDRDASVIPVIVTFDELSAFGIVYKWLDSRCKAHALLRQSKVTPAVIASIGEYESLMALGAHGRSITGMLSKMTSDEWRTAKMDGFLHDQAGDEPSILRLKFLNDEFVAFSEKSKARLFPGAMKSAPLGGS